MSVAQPPTVDHEARRERVRAALTGQGPAALLVTDRSNVRWLTGFSGSNATLLLGPDRATLVTDGRYATQAQREVPGLGDAVALVTAPLEAWLSATVGVLDVVGVEAAHLSYARARHLLDGDAPPRLQPVGDLVTGLRRVKDPAETAVLAEACRVTAASFAAMWTWLAPGMTEREVAHRLLGEMIARGADGPAFAFIVAAGPGGAEPHHRPTSRPLASGELVTVDAGAELGGYHADMTRTVALGRPPPRLAAVHDVVAAAQRDGVAACVVDAPGATVDAACRTVVTAAGHAERFVHPTGHGVGLDIHEEPILHSRQEARLAAGMAVTVEPGVYLPGVGGVRVEDVVAVRSDGPRVLTADHDSDPARHVRAPVGGDTPDPSPAHPLIEL